MLGDAKLGAVLRELREGRDLTLTAVARRAGCVESTVSYVECGHRRLKPWLAQEFDRIYDTGGAIAALASSVGNKPH
jgi:transcriptional regulator with XRE-family HTH domain